MRNRRPDQCRPMARAAVAGQNTDAADLAHTLHSLGKRSGAVVFTVAPRTTLLMAMWYAGKLFPRSDRSPVMIPHGLKDLGRAVGPGLARVGRVARGFYISDCLEYRP